MLPRLRRNSAPSHRVSSDTHKGMRSSVTKRLRWKSRGRYLARPMHSAKAPRHSQQHFAFPRRCQACGKLYVDAHKAVRGETPREANGVDPLVARKPSRRSNNRLAEGPQSEGRSRWSPATIGGSGLYPGGNSPRRNQHDHGERPTRAGTYIYVQCYWNHSGITFGDRRDFDLRDVTSVTKSTKSRENFHISTLARVKSRNPSLDFFQEF